MLDINYIRENIEIIKKAVLDKGLDVDIHKLLGLDQKRRELIGKVDELRSQRNIAAKEKNIEKGREIKEELNGLEKQLKNVEDEYNSLMLYVPNIPSSDSPVGPDSKSNKEISKWGEISKFGFKPKDHIKLGKLLDIVDLEAGVKVSGFRGFFLKNEGTILHLAILNYAFDKIVAAGFTPMTPPTLVHESVLVGSGHIPFAGDNTYQIKDLDHPLFLTGTSEPSLLAYFMDKTLSEDELPVKVCAMTHCFRSEVGDYGKDTRGLYRVHEFDKVEQVVICKNDLEESESWFKKMQEISEQILQSLSLPYHVIVTSTGDMGAGKYMMFDIETWMPSRESYGETHSNSNLTDWQARRLNLKFRTIHPSSGGKTGQTFFAFTLNNTVIASPRILIPLLENFQQEDGSVKIPDVLQKYTGFSEIKPK